MSVEGHTRRRFLGALGAAAMVPGIGMTSTQQTNPGAARPARRFRVRTVTAGVTLASIDDVGAVTRAAQALLRVRQRFVDEGYEVQTIRVATNPLVAALDRDARARQLASLVALDRAAGEHQALLSIGPVLTEDRADPDLAAWAADFAAATRHTSFSVVVASATGGVHRRAALEAAAVIGRLSRVGGDGAANFRFAAAANIPAGTPFFPVAWHAGAENLAVGLESANLVSDAFTSAGAASAEVRLRAVLDEHLGPIDRLARAWAREERRSFAGIDPSPAPGLDCSIASGIEALSGAPFGAAGTLDACATVTAALKALSVRTTGYAGLMLPVLEDTGLAARAGEGRYGVEELLLCSSVCGTGLDVVPLPGDVGAPALARLITDVAALATRLGKPLSARLFPAPGKSAGERVSFDNPYLTPCVVLPLE
jgi:uncharacterized protein (UPF0210 family)